MAHRNIKITRKIVQTCNKLRTLDKSALSCLITHKTTDFPEFPNKNVNTTKLHSSVTACKGNIRSEGDLFEKLGRNIESPSLFPGCSHKNDIFNLHNVEPDLINSKQSLPFVSITRCYSNKKKTDKCKYPNPKCVKNRTCPKFVMKDCPQANEPPDCMRKYQEVNCTKKMAPYPSYSELCAYRLEDDPSECHQCPWTKCGGADDIKPQKKSYHTSTRAFSMAVVPSKNFTNTEQCKEPPPKCKKKEKGSKCPKKEKCPEKEKKKQCAEQPGINEAWIISGSMRNLDLQRFYFSKLKLDRLREETDQPTGTLPDVHYELDPGESSKSKCPKRHNKCPVIDQTINEKYRPMDPCCKEDKKGQKPRAKPKVYVPTPRNY